MFIASIFLLRYLGEDAKILTTMPKLLFSIIFLILLIIIESLILSHWRTTPGKKLLKINIYSDNEKEIAYTDAFLRTIKVWFYGLGLGIPLITLFTQVKAFNKLTNNGITSWDKEGNFIISYEEVATWRIVFATIIVILLFVLYIKFSR